MFEFDPYSPAIDADPFPAYQRLREDYPCYWSDQAGMWVLSRYADIVRALNDWTVFSSAQGNLMTEFPGRPGATLGTTDPPRHDRLRGLIQHAFLKRNLDSLGPSIAGIAGALAAELRDRREFDFVEDFAAKFTTRVLVAVLGLPAEDEVEIRENAVLMVQSDPVTRQKSPKHLAAFDWMRNYAAGIIAERRARPTEDLISQFSLAEIDGDRLADNEVLLTTTTLIMAGTESLGGFLAMFGLNMADMPEIRRQCAANPQLLADAIEESLRYNTSAQRFRRCLTRDIDLHGQSMKAGQFVCLAYGSGNRDGRQFPNADTYDLGRKPRGHLGFGGGVHACLGSAVARLAIRIGMEAFHAAIPDYERVEAELDWMPSSTFRSPLAVKLAIA